VKLGFSKQAARAFTLIEIVITTALMSVVLASAYICLNAGLASKKVIEARADVLQNGRVALARMSADLRAACPLSKKIEFLGMHRVLGEMTADNLDFGTHNYTPKREHEADFCEVSYYLQKGEEDGEFNLWIRRDPTPDDDPVGGGTQEEIATGVKGLRFEYYDGFDWYEEWGDATGKRQSSNREQPNLYGLPDAVRITLFLEANGSGKKGATNEPPMVFQSVARLYLAPHSQKSTSSSSSSSSSESTGQAEPAAGQPFPGGPQ